MGAGRLDAAAKAGINTGTLASIEVYYLNRVPSRLRTGHRAGARSRHAEQRCAPCRFLLVRAKGQGQPQSGFEQRDKQVVTAQRVAGGDDASVARVAELLYRLMEPAERLRHAFERRARQAARGKVCRRHAGEGASPLRRLAVTEERRIAPQSVTSQWNRRCEASERSVEHVLLRSIALASQHRGFAQDPRASSADG